LKPSSEFISAIHGAIKVVSAPSIPAPLSLMSA
jgi:hypothetical protein